MMPVRDRIGRWARAIKQDTLALYLAVRDVRTPWYAKALAALIVGYALSPIDLIPDFIPVLGILDDLLIVPLGLWIATRLIPRDVMDDCRRRAVTLAERPVSRVAAVFIVIIWLVAAFAGWRLYADWTS